MPTRKSRTLKMRKSKKTRNNRKYSRKQYGSGVTTMTFNFYVNPKGGSPPKLIGTAPNGITIRSKPAGFTFEFANPTSIIKVGVTGVNRNGATVNPSALTPLFRKSNTSILTAPRLTSGMYDFKTATMLKTIDIAGIDQGKFGTLSEKVSPNIIVTLTMDDTPTTTKPTTTKPTTTKPTTTKPTTTMPTTTMPTTTMPTTTMLSTVT